MHDWLNNIQCGNGDDPYVRKFIQANPDLDSIMNTHLAKDLNLSEPRSIQKWIELYRMTAGECLQSHVKISLYSAYKNKCLP